MADSEPPRPVHGLRAALRLWPLVGLVWLLPLAATLPAVLVVQVVVGAPLENLPYGAAAPGDALLVGFGAAAEVARPLALAVAAGALLLWASTVLWHAGTISWWGAGSRPLRLAELVARGALRFWPFARLSVVALLALVTGLTVVLTPVTWAARQAYEAMAEGTTVALVALGLGLVLLWLAVVWAATLRGAWRLGFDPRRSALRGWFGGLLETFRRPGTTVGVVALAAVLMTALALAPLLLGAAVPLLRGGLLGAAVATVAGLGRALVAVALLLAFAPTERP